MKELNISQTISMHRRKKGVTQEELAYYMGVSKASVSKWETGQSYPDITFLPQLASYFNISVDDLIGYEPQMEKEDIRKLCKSYCKEFSERPFEEVFSKCQDTVKKYYSCYPLVFRIAFLYLNHAMLAKDITRQEEVIKEACALFVRIKTECEDLDLAKEASCGEAASYLFLDRPADALAVLGEEIRPVAQGGDLIAQAYLRLGNVKAAAKTCQVLSYQYLIGFLSQVPSLLRAEEAKPGKAEMLLDRALAMEQIFQVDRLHPNSMALIYLSAIQIYAGRGDTEKMLFYLERYVDMADNFFPLKLHGDHFFDRVEEWFEETDSGMEAPREEILVKESIYQSIAETPFCLCLKEDPQYKKLILKLKQKLGMED